jgi:hypothetical protein
MSGAGSNRLPILATEINARHNEAHEAAQTTMGHAIACGRLLLEAQESLGHGKWLPWIGENLSFGARQAQKYMRLARHADELPNTNSNSHFSIDQALQALAEPAVAEPVRKLHRFAELLDSGMDVETAAAQSGADVTIIKDKGYAPFASCDEDGRREWLLFVLFGVPWPHVEWLLQRQFKSPADWIGENGTRFRKQCRLKQFPDSWVDEWEKFRDEHAAVPIAEIERRWNDREAA